VVLATSGEGAGGTLATQPACGCTQLIHKYSSPPPHAPPPPGQALARWTGAHALRGALWGLLRTGLWAFGLASLRTTEVIRINNLPPASVRVFRSKDFGSSKSSEIGSTKMLDW
jgi:hypothetical protein